MTDDGPEREDLRRFRESLSKAAAAARQGAATLGRSRTVQAALAAARDRAREHGFVWKRAPGRRTITVWDLPTRIFKWLLVLFVSAAFLFSSMRPHGLLFVVHIACGYAVILLLLFRLAWGFIGGEQARFRAFVRGWRTVAAQGEALLRLHTEETAGHNPIGGWMILLMLATLSVTALTGLLTEGSTGGAGVLSGLLPVDWVGPIGWIHGTLGFAILWIAGFHVGGVLLESLLHNENLVRTMITGRKQVVSPRLADAGTVSLWRAVPIVLALALVGAWMISGTRLPASPTPHATAASDR
jgi:cytochrome b